MARMSRTTIMAPDDLLDELRAMARERGVSLGQEIREALVLHTRLRSRRRPRLRFIGAIATGEPGDDTASRIEEILCGLPPEE
jgi:hypothetical protein